MNHLVNKLLIILALFLPSFAFAVDGEVDTTALIAKIVAIGVAAALLGNASLLVKVGIKVFHWIRGAM